MTKHIVTVRDGDIVELRPEGYQPASDQDTTGYMTVPQPIPGSPPSPGGALPQDLRGRIGVIISCPPMPRPPVLLQGDDVQAFMSTNYPPGGRNIPLPPGSSGGGPAAPMSWAFEWAMDPFGTTAKQIGTSIDNL